MKARSLIPVPIAEQSWQAILPLTLLVCFGAAVLYSAAGGSMNPFASSHLLRFGLFLAMALVMSYFPRGFVKLVAYPSYAVTLVLLVLVEAIGFVGGGSQRWIDLGPLVLQPSELMKPAIVLTLASFYSTLPPGEIGGWRSVIPPAVLIAMPAGLVLLQPDQESACERSRA